MRKFTVLLVAFAGALSAFLITMVTTPPTTEAAQPRPSINISDLTIQANLPMAEPTDAF